MEFPSSDTDQLVERAHRGESAATQQLFAKHRSQLKRMVSVRIDPRVATRVDPSDIVLYEIEQVLLHGDLLLDFISFLGHRLHTVLTLGFGELLEFVARIRSFATVPENGFFGISGASIM